uniref:Cytochrome c6 n=1 Tax=Cladophora glomerata TaxID=162068 RepID=CYC6_CLAGO|nr:RecName: Full=Cytochrome c6; AltName: Full=Cytochrome c-553; AltName: Full=Cytochrome c553; AltName: Full=Soluble cytochrome f [Cladophora glomerata]1LS9_A Chain A, Cytochrome C6 [Cladophora glomerata]
VDAELLADGKKVFAGNCAACHLGGNNSVLADKTLKKDAIEKYLEGGLTLEAIKYQVNNGKGAMPAWADRLDEDDIEAVSNYVYDQAVNSKW